METIGQVVETTRVVAQTSIFEVCGLFFQEYRNERSQIRVPRSEGILARSIVRPRGTRGIVAPPFRAAPPAHDLKPDVGLKPGATDGPAAIPRREGFDARPIRDSICRVCARPRSPRAGRAAPMHRGAIRQLTNANVRQLTDRPARGRQAGQKLAVFKSTHSTECDGAMAQR